MIQRYEQMKNKQKENIETLKYELLEEQLEKLEDLDESLQSENQE